VEAKTLDDAVTALLASLDEAQRAELVALVRSYRIEPAHTWIREVIAMFGLTDSAEALIADIDRRFPDESALKLIESDSDLPIFEANIILREAQRRLREQAKSANDLGKGHR
jgi:hypothetical protein